MILIMIKLTTFYMEMNRKNKVFIDTSAFIAFVLDTEPYHSIVADWFRKCFREGVSMITTDYIIDELLTFLRCKKRDGKHLVIVIIRD